MRVLIVGTALLFATTASAQSRWTLSTGPEWRPYSVARLWRVRFRAEYDVTTLNITFGINLENGTRRSPTQSYWFPAGNGSFGGTEQRLDLMLGVNASLSPVPHARVSPYVTFGVFGRQQWTNGSRFNLGETNSSQPKSSYSAGDILTSMGIGLRLRLEIGRASCRERV